MSTSSPRSTDTFCSRSSRSGCSSSFQAPKKNPCLSVYRSAVTTSSSSSIPRICSHSLTIEMRLLLPASVSDRFFFEIIFVMLCHICGTDYLNVVLHFGV